MSAPAVSVAKVSLSVGFLVVATALTILAAVAFRLHCEGFGCTGVGIVWLAWVAIYAPVLVAGFALRLVLPSRTVIKTAVTTGLAGLAALGAALGCYWLLHNAA